MEILTKNLPELININKEILKLNQNFYTSKLKQQQQQQQQWQQQQQPIGPIIEEVTGDDNIEDSLKLNDQIDNYFYKQNNVEAYTAAPLPPQSSSQVQQQQANEQQKNYKLENGSNNRSSIFVYMLIMPTLLLFVLLTMKDLALFVKAIVMLCTIGHAIIVTKCLTSSPNISNAM